MDIFEGLRSCDVVAKFQQVCGVERLPSFNQQDSDETEGGHEEFQNSPSYDPSGKYVKHRHSHKYVLKESYKNNNTVKSTEQDLQKEGIPPFTSDDSDSDNGQVKGQGRFKVTPHRINNKILYFAFKIASFFGDEAFYLTFFPFLAWNIDSYIVRHTVYVWSIAMFAGQVTKDIFQWPRPSSPPVIRLETDFAQEFSMPSTHAVAGSSIPFVLAYSIINRYQVSTTLVVVVAVIWCLMVCCSRLYLGVHSVLDLIVGVLYSLVVAAVILPFIEQIDWFVQTSPLSPVVIFLSCLVLSTFGYPAPEIDNNTRGDSIQVIAATAGCLMGVWCNYFNEMSVVVPRDGLLVISPPTLKFFATAILRFVIGVITLALVKTVVKTISVKGVSYVIGLPKPDRHNRKVIVYYKLITYSALGIIIMWTVPILHTKFGLARPTFYQEVV